MPVTAARKPALRLGLSLVFPVRGLLFRLLFRLLFGLLFGRLFGLLFGLLSGLLVFSLITGLFAVLNVFDDRSYVIASAVSELYVLAMMGLIGYMTYYLAYRKRKIP